MLDRNVSLYPAEFGEAPLSQAFRQAWLEWCESWRGAAGLGNSASEQVERIAETSTLLVRRLWRSAFARVGDASASQVKAMVYAFVALVDERMLFSEWAGREAWQSRPLEVRLYGSRHAGERLPRAIHRLLEERLPASRDLANVYLQCLVLGFYGALRSERGRGLHARWRHALFTFAWQREPAASGVLSSLGRPARVAVLRRPLCRVLPDSARLGLAVCAALVLLTVAGQWMWHDIQSELEDPLQRMISLDENGQPGE